MRKNSWKETNLIFLSPFDTFLSCPKGDCSLQRMGTLPLYCKWLRPQARCFLSHTVPFFPESLEGISDYHFVIF